MEEYDVVIVGTGPAGLGAAFELSEKNPRLRVLLLDRENFSTGGLRNDCKMNFSYPIGFPLDSWKQAEAEAYLVRVAEVLDPPIMEKRNLATYERRAERVGARLLLIRQAHLGTDGGLALIKRFVAELKSRGVAFILGTETGMIGEGLRSISLKPQGEGDATSIGFKKLIVAPGRSGFAYLQGLMRSLGIPFTDNAIDIGVRVEARIERYPIVADYYDPKFLFPEKVRTFCTNSGAAYVVQEVYESASGAKWQSVNGHAFSGARPSNGLVNFALLRSLSLTEPLASGQSLAEMLGFQATLLGGGHPIMQRIGDFRMGRRSTREGFNGDLYDFEPTLPSATPGDVSLAMPAKVLRSVWKSLKLLDTIVPGILHPSGILYYPEIKLYANKPRFIDEHFMVAPGIYMLGDGAGTSRGITAAWASGIRAADGILSALI